MNINLLINEYLVNNQSSPLFTKDEEDSINIKPSSLILLEDDTNSELCLFNLKDSESTNDESMLLKEKSEDSKRIIKTWLDKSTK